MGARKRIRPIKKERIYKTIAQSIIEFIDENEYITGDSLPTEVELAEMCCVSRTSIREAIIYLESLGLIHYDPKKNHYIVNEVNIRNINKNIMFAIMMNEMTFKDLIDVRYILELGAVEFAIDNFNKEYEKQFEAIINEAEKKIKNNSSPYIEDYNFHKLILKLSNNIIIDKLNVILEEFFYKKPTRFNYNNDKQSVEQHKKILEYIKDKDIENAKVLLKEHLSHLHEKNYYINRVII